MGEAAVVSCPECGAPVAVDDRHCSYCRSPIATVRCARCYAMNSPNAPYCSGCGLGLGLSPLGDPAELACPDCGVALTRFAGGPGELLDCERCGGQFVDHALIRDLIERREIYGAAAPRPYRKENPLSARVVYRRCPACQNLMNRRNFGGESGIIVDQCARHGTWFDRGELPRVLAFVESGGLARARRHEAEELARRKQADRAAVFPVAAGSFEVGNADPASSGVLEDAFQAASLLLDAIVKLLRPG